MSMYKSLLDAKSARRETKVSKSNEKAYKASIDELHLLDALKDVFKEARFEKRQVEHSVMFVSEDIIKYLVDSLQRLGYTVEDRRITHNKAVLLISW